MFEKKKGFRIMKLIVRKASGPWQHFYALLSQKTNTETPNALGRLVWGGTSRIIDDFQALLDTSTWAPVLMEHAEDASQAKDMLTAALVYSASQQRWVRSKGSSSPLSIGFPDTASGQERPKHVL